MVVEIKSVEEFAEKVLKSDSLVVVDFWGPRCVPCVEFGPLFAEFDADYPSVFFYKVNDDECSELLEQHGINCLPTFKLYKNGECIDTLEGDSEEEFKEMIDKYAK